MDKDGDGRLTEDEVKQVNVFRIRSMRSWSFQTLISAFTCEKFKTFSYLIFYVCVYEILTQIYAKMLQGHLDFFKSTWFKKEK